MIEDPVIVPAPRADASPAPTRFVYDGKPYFVVSCDTAKQELILERIDKPAEAGLPRLAEAVQVLIEEKDDDGRPCLMRCALTHEVEERGRFLMTRWVRMGRIGG